MHFGILVLVDFQALDCGLWIVDCGLSDCNISNSLLDIEELYFFFVCFQDVHFALSFIRLYTWHSDFQVNSPSFRIIVHSQNNSFNFTTTLLLINPKMASRGLTEVHKCAKFPGFTDLSCISSGWNRLSANKIVISAQLFPMQPISGILLVKASMVLNLLPYIQKHVSVLSLM